MSDLENLLRELAGDANFRRAFADAPAAVLRARGYDPDQFTVPERMDLQALEARLQAWAAEVKGPAVSEPAGGVPEAGALAVEDGGRMRCRLGARRRQFAPESGAQQGPLGQTRAIEPFGEPGAAPAAAPAMETAPAAEAAPEDQEPGKAAPRAKAIRAESAPAESAAEYPSAWFGTYGTAVSRVLISGAEASRLVPETIVDADDRVLVTTTDRNPFRWLCRLVILAPNGTRWSGTGWLAGPRLVLTAGHCVYMQNQGGWAQRIQVFVYDANGDLGPPIEAEDAASVAGWVTDADPEQDYGAIALPAGVHTPGWFGFGSFSDQVLAASVGNIAGFPVDKPAGTLWGHARRLSQVRPNIIFYEIDTYGGMSGAPVIAWGGQDYVVVGIHNYGDIAGNRATRINPTVYQNIEAWLAAYA
jgi:V8-like Glu-specific endopeptidase